MADANESAVEDMQPVEPELTPEERKHRAFQRAIALKGKFQLDINIDELRGRRGIEARACDVRAGDMAKVEKAETGVPEKRVWPPRTMDDLSPEDRAKQMRFAAKLKALQGKAHLNIDLDELRGRTPVAASAPESQRIEAIRQAVSDDDMSNRSEAAVIDRLTENKPVETELTPEERKHRAFQRLRALKGKIHLDIDIDELRGRNR